MLTNSKNKEIIDSLNIEFEPNEFDLNGWGRVDFYSKGENDTLIFVEVENRQKHPQTNVLKIWPFLEENPSIKILLIHIILPQKIKKHEPSKNRLKLCKFVGDKLEKLFNDRFRYIYIKGNPWDESSLNEQIKKDIEFLSNT